MEKNRKKELVVKSIFMVLNQVKCMKDLTIKKLYRGAHLSIVEFLTL